jgi:hypothetical protein
MCVHMQESQMRFRATRDTALLGFCAIVGPQLYLGRSTHLPSSMRSSNAERAKVEWTTPLSAYAKDATAPRGQPLCGQTTESLPSERCLPLIIHSRLLSQPIAGTLNSAYPSVGDGKREPVLASDMGLVDIGLWWPRSLGTWYMLQYLCSTLVVPEHHHNSLLGITSCAGVLQLASNLILISRLPH